MDDGVTLAVDQRFIVGLIADYETVVGFLLAGIGEFINPAKNIRNYLMVTEDTAQDEINLTFRRLCEAKSIGVIFIGTEIYQTLRPLIEQRKRALPLIVEIPSRKSLGTHKPSDF